MKTMLTLVVVAALTGCATMRSQNASVTLEFRPGSQSPGSGLTEMTVPGSERPVYVSDDVLLSNADVESARVVSGPHGPQIEVVFTRAGTERFTTATEQNIMKPLAILVDGKLLSAPIVREKITGGRAVLSGRFTEQEAKRIADGIVGK
jgi:preprotein translocase subunit SecD